MSNAYPTTAVSIKDGFSGIPDGRTYVIAEASTNHNGDLELAKQMVDIAVECGADAVKFQKRDIGSTMTAGWLDRPFNIPNADGEEWGRTYRAVREHIELSPDELSTLRGHCAGRIDFVVTPFDVASVEVLEAIGVDAYKISSFSLTDIPLLEAVAPLGKTVFLSTGMSVEDDLVRAVEVLGETDLVLMHCVSAYPMKPRDANLRLLQWLERFGRPVGWSDHEVGISLSPVAVALGARVVERHFTTNRVLPGFDQAMSLEPTGLRKCVRDIRKTEQALSGLRDHREVLECEMQAFDQRRRTIVSVRDIKKGERFSRGDLTTKAPNRGLPPHLIPELIGKEALEDIPADTHITFAMVHL